mgnify:CR=1 FL=1
MRLCIMGENYIPKIPFPEYKWFFATKQPTESLGDPAVLLGLVNRMVNIENGHTKYSSDAFKKVLCDLDNDIKTPINLSKRVGARNLMRNSGQYWKVFGLIPQEDTNGIIQLTPLGREIAAGKVNQIDFAASIIVTFVLPNKVSYKKEQIWKWKEHDLTIHPFKLLLNIIRDLWMIDSNEGWITNQELYSIVVPMAGDKKKPEEIAEIILQYRKDQNVIDGWPNCVPKSNDKRFCGEYLRFLANFGYLVKAVSDSNSRDTSRYQYIPELDFEIEQLINGKWSENSSDLIQLIQKADIASMVSMSSISRSNIRPGQQKFRHNLLETIKRCPITGVDLPNVLQAAHIKPHAFGGPESVDNGLPLRADIHCLFDAGLLMIKPINSDRLCQIEITDPKAVANYREFVDKFFKVPDITNMEYIKWRYDNKLLGAVD